MAKKIVTITAEDQWCDPLQLGSEGATLIIDNNNLFHGTLTVQFKTDDFDNWINDATYTTNVVEHIKGSSEIYVRIGCATGDYMSGNIKAILYRGGIA